ncbi:hypothetical protein L6452_05108 [Arctium lappa]|uniref:Uncharacterized protein n=1 Tax=Arctium lappa TaxID=4217 RepID=A0ACB9EFH0_ARCLA|nr:hypothetical protein L6452_05108 [Arctium lappa]
MYADLYSNNRTEFIEVMLEESGVDSWTAFIERVLACYCEETHLLEKQLVALITPFKFPLEIPVLQLMGALFMGNKPILKVDSKGYPTVSIEYNKAIDKARRKLRGFIADKKWAPLMLCLAWHSAGTYDVKTKTGGPFVTMRHKVELGHAANNGLGIALAGVVAAEITRGPDVSFHPGRVVSIFICY